MWTIGHWRNVPVRIHWTFPLMAAFYSRLAFAPGAWLGLVLVVLFHEVGHAVLVRLHQGLQVVAINFAGWGGECEYVGYPTPIGRAVIAWGGVLGQAVLFGFAVLARDILGPPPSPMFQTLFEALTAMNFLTAMWNLLPFERFDGRTAWTLPLLVAERLFQRGGSAGTTAWKTGTRRARLRSASHLSVVADDADEEAASDDEAPEHKTVVH